MNRLALAFLFLFCCPLFAAAEEKVIFGPVTYDVKERYGLDNVYSGSFSATDGLYLIRMQLGSKTPERPEYLELTVNGQKVLPDDLYEFSYIACIVRLQKDNSFEIRVKDAKPTGFKRPPLPPRFAIMSVLPYTGKLPEGSFGLAAWEGLNELATMLQKIPNPASAALAAASVSVRNDLAARAQAMRGLSDNKEMSALPFISAVFSNSAHNGDVRGEAAIALGMLGARESIPMLVNGLLDSEEKPRLASARALSFFKEEDTREPLIKLLERLDTMRRDAVISAIVTAGWKPVSALMTLAQSQDAHVSHNALAILGTTRDPRATDLLLKLLKDPGQRDLRRIISALGDTHDARAVDPLLAVANDPALRAGRELELGEALSNLGDQRAASVIAGMIKRVDTRSDRVQLQQAYKRLTGKDFK
jgi:HEAT repeat protein